MERRQFFGLVSGLVMMWPLVARAQRPERVRRIGVLMANIGPVAQSEVAALLGALKGLGWTEGSNLQTEVRWGAGDADRIRSSSKELLNLRPDLIVANGTPSVVALVREMNTIPIVFVNVADPISSGFVEGLSRPGGNLTGFTTDNSELGGKWVELLKELAPRTVHVSLLFNPATVVPLKIYMPSIQAAASSSAVEVNAAPVHAQDEIEGVIAAQAREPGGSIIVMPDPFNVTNSQQIILLTARYGVPAMYFTPTYFAESGGLVAYGSDFAEQFPQAAVYVDRILRGAKPAELPVQAPTKFDLVINLKTAKALGLDLSPSLLARAARVIE
jgi:putative tryptophan/tyrosine transport system substrate-binding protein